MNSGSPSRIVGGFEVLEVPDDPYHGRYKQSCAAQNCYVPGQAMPGYFEYFEDSRNRFMSSKQREFDNYVLMFVFVVAVVLFCIISSSK